VQNKIEELAELHESHYEQNQRQHEEMITKVSESTNIIGSALKNTSNEINIKFEKLSEDIEYVTHKETLKEKELYSIKQKFEIIK
jgi:molybdate-binding protein